MIAVWMAYALGISLLLGGATLGVERVLTHRRLPTRWLWAAVMLASALVPLLRQPLRHPGGASVSDAFYAPLLDESSMAPSPGAQPLHTALDVALAAGWLAASVGVLLFLTVAAARLRRHHQRWRGDLVEGERVRVSRRTGPAVVGFLAPEIVVPAWVLHLPSSERKLLVLHERAHLEARDPLLVLGGLAAVVAFPWNPALWWQLGRLRAAIEMDCDARLVERGVDTQRYGLLLLDVARRVTAHGALATSFAASRSVLERRIVALAAAPHSIRRRVRVLLGGGAVAAAGVSAVIPAPELGNPLGIVRSALAAAPADPPRGSVEDDTTRRPRLRNRHEAPGIVHRHYPAALREAGVGGVAVVWAFVDRTGRVRSVTLAESSTHPELDQAARSVMRELRFEPARRGAEAVATWLQYPITFVPQTTPDSRQAGNRVAIWTAPTPPPLARLR